MLLPGTSSRPPCVPVLPPTSQVLGDVLDIHVLEQQLHVVAGGHLQAAPAADLSLLPTFSFTLYYLAVPTSADFNHVIYASMSGGAQRQGQQRGAERRHGHRRQGPARCRSCSSPLRHNAKRDAQQLQSRNQHSGCNARLRHSQAWHPNRIRPPLSWPACARPAWAAPWPRSS